MGASVATFVSYFLVYIVRSATMGRFMRFKLYHGKLAINTVLIIAIAVVMTLYGGEWQGIAISASILAISVVFNLRDVVMSARQILSSVKKKKTN